MKQVKGGENGARSRSRKGRRRRSSVGSRVRSVSKGRGEENDEEEFEYNWQCGVCLNINKFDPACEDARKMSCELCSTPGVVNVPKELEGGGNSNEKVGELDALIDTDDEAVEGEMLEDEALESEIKSLREETKEGTAGLGLEEDELTGLYFHCQAKGCETVTCLRCLKMVPTNSVLRHDCDGELRSLTVYKEIVNVLNDAASQECKKCKHLGIKDLACTHITCTCGAKWCYLCGMLKPRGGFGKHNQWKENGKKKVGHCPMYLKDMYGGQPKFALKMFHMHKQLVAVTKYLKERACEGSLERELFRDCLKEFFPGGIIPHSEMELMVKFRDKKIHKEDEDWWFDDPREWHC